MGAPLPDKTGRKTGVSMRAACSRLMVGMPPNDYLTSAYLCQYLRHLACQILMMCGATSFRPPMSYLGLDKEGHAARGAPARALACLFL
jgi:hypothetical protein